MILPGEAQPKPAQLITEKTTDPITHIDASTIYVQPVSGQSSQSGQTLTPLRTTYVHNDPLTGKPVCMAMTDTAQPASFALAYNDPCNLHKKFN